LQPSLRRWKPRRSIADRTDLLERTLDAGDIFDFLDGRLAKRFILSADQIPARLAGFELDPDAEGRHRVNECYCHDSTWRDTLAALLARSDVVLMGIAGKSPALDHRVEQRAHRAVALEYA
jgi:hypothetical protein